MPDDQKLISLTLFEGLLRHNLDAATQAELAQAIRKLKGNLHELDVEVANEPACQHSLSDDGLFSVACGECGVVVDATPCMDLIGGLVKEAMEMHPGEEDMCELDEESLTDLLVRAASESVVNYALASPAK